MIWRGCFRGEIQLKKNRITARTIFKLYISICCDYTNLKSNQKYADRQQEATYSLEKSWRLEWRHPERLGPMDANLAMP